MVSSSDFFGKGDDVGEFKVLAQFFKSEVCKMIFLVIIAVAGILWGATGNPIWAGYVLPAFGIVLIVDHILLILSNRKRYRLLLGARELLGAELPASRHSAIEPGADGTMKTIRQHLIEILGAKSEDAQGLEGLLQYTPHDVNDPPSERLFHTLISVYRFINVCLERTRLSRRTKRKIEEKYFAKKPQK